MSFVLSRKFCRFGFIAGFLSLNLIAPASWAKKGSAESKVYNAFEPGLIEKLPESPMDTDEYINKALKVAEKSGQRKVAQIDFLDRNRSLEADHLCLIARISGYGSDQAEADATKKICSSPSAKFAALTDASGKPRGVETAEELDRLIRQLEEIYPVVMDNDQIVVKNLQGLSPGARFLAAQLIALKPFRSLVFRARPLVENLAQKQGGRAEALVTDASMSKSVTKANPNLYNSSGELTHRRKNAPVAYASAVTLLRAAATGINNFLPTPEWKAGFDYITMPLDDMNFEFLNDENFRAWVVAEWAYSMNDLLRRTKGIRNDVRDSGKKFYWDNRVLYSTSNFTDSRDRYQLIGYPELELYVAGTHLLLSSSQSLGAYRLDGLFEFLDQVAIHYGFGAAVDNMDRLTARKRFELLTNQPDFLVLDEGKDGNEKGGARLMKRAYDNLKQAVKLAKIAWLYMDPSGMSNDKSVDSRSLDSDSRNNFLDPLAAVPFRRILRNNFNLMERLVQESEANGHAEIKSDLTGEKVNVAFSRFFLSPPKDLKVFAPTHFKDENCGKVAREQVRNVRFGNKIEKKLKFRNYQYGSPAAWNLMEWNKYFPRLSARENETAKANQANSICGIQSTNIEDRATNQIQMASRVMAQSWGGWIVALPMSLFMF